MDTTFTVEEVIALLIIGCVILSLAILLIKGMFKVALTLFVSAIIFGFGFGWLPEQLEAIKNGEKTQEQVINEAFTANTINTSLNTSKDYYEQNKESIGGIVNSAFDKLYHIFFPKTPEETPGDGTVDNTVENITPDTGGDGGTTETVPTE